MEMMLNVDLISFRFLLALFFFEKGVASLDGIIFPQKTELIHQSHAYCSTSFIF